MRRPVPGLSLMADAAYRKVVAPLLDGGRVGAIEWTVDLGFAPWVVPPWIEQLLAFYGERGLCYGHGFSFSPLAGSFRPRQAAWLEALSADLQRHRYEHLSEHFCFSFGGDFTEAGPLPVPMTSNSVAIGRDRLARLAAVAQRPIGLENLATSPGPRDALDQGEFLERLLSPTDGFVVLDVHNLFCQCHNFGLDPGTLLATYPLDRVREIHVSGGSWDATSVAPDAPVRRDTHDDAVPDEVFEILRIALSQCSKVEAVFLERLPGTFHTPEDGERFRADYERMIAVMREAAPQVSERASPEARAHDGAASRGDASVAISQEFGPVPPEDEELSAFQAALLDLLAEERPADEIQRLLAEHSASLPYADYLAQLDLRCVEVAGRITRKFGRRSPAVA